MSAPWRSSMSPIPPPIRGNSGVRVACERSEAGLWLGRAVVVDLFRFSNTVCALLKSGRSDVRVFSSPSSAIAVKKAEKNSDLFSEIEMPPEVDRYDNSPYTALCGSDSSRPALIVTNSGSPAVMALSSSKEILIGCFANAPALGRYCRSNPMPTLIVPACLYYDRGHVEDFICARSLAQEIEGRDTFPDALGEIHSSGRVLDFLSLRPLTGKKDMEIALARDIMKIVPRVRLIGGCGIVEDAAAAELYEK